MIAFLFLGLIVSACLGGLAVYSAFPKTPESDKCVLYLPVVFEVTIDGISGNVTHGVWASLGSKWTFSEQYTPSRIRLTWASEDSEDDWTVYVVVTYNATERWKAVDWKILGENGRNGRCFFLMIPTEKTITIVAQFTTKHVRTEEKAARAFVERYLAPEQEQLEYLSKWSCSLWVLLAVALLAVVVVLCIHITKAQQWLRDQDPEIKLREASARQYGELPHE
ncbi:MAG: hypothetical protein WCC94_03060 [Candidatus Bathyarchaeia archaeon]